MACPTPMYKTFTDDKNNESDNKIWNHKHK